MAKESDILAEAKERLKESDDAWVQNRADALDDLKFARLGEQWPDKVRKDREREGRPCLTINKLPAFIRQVVNDARMNRPSIKVHPVDSGSDPETAEIMSGLIRNIEYSSDADVAYDTAAEHAISCGFGFFRVDVDYACDDTFDLDILIRRINNPFSVHFDPYSTAADSSDWRYAFLSDFLPKEDFLKRYKGAEVSDWESEDAKEQLWREGDTVRVAEYWTREEVPSTILMLSDGVVLHEDQYLKNREVFDVAGLQVVGTRQSKTYKVMQRIVSGAQVLEENPWAGRYIPIIPVYGDELDVEGKRYFRSLVRDAKDAQQMFNYWRTASTELVALAPKAPFIGPKGAFNTDAQKWATANVKSHPFIEYDGGIPPQRQAFSGVPAGAIQEALNASDDMKSIMGLYDASLGARSNETSGRAIIARQREGDVSTFHFIDNLTRGIRHAGRVLVDLIPRVYDKPRILRVMGEDGSPKSVQVNQPMPQQDGTSKVFDLTAGRYDLTVSSGPGYTTRREEAAQQMTELLRSFPQAAPYIGDLLAKNLDWPGADEIAKRLKAMLPPQLQEEGGIPPHVQAMIEQGKQAIGQLQGQLQAGMAEFRKVQSELEQAKKALQDKQAELSIKAKEAELKHDAEIAKSMAEVRVAEIEAESAMRIASVETILQAIQARIDGLASNMQHEVQEEGPLT